MKTVLPYYRKKYTVLSYFKVKAILICVFFLFCSLVNAMINNNLDYTISNKALQLSNVTVGTGGNYTTLKAAFDAINAGMITGTVTVQIISNTVETATAALNSSGTGLANYTTILIYATGSGFTVGGNVANPLITFNGADNVTIDGRVNATGATANLTFSNSSTAVSAGAVRFVNSAENNTIKYAILSASGISAAAAVIHFSTAAAGNGNDNNTIENCNLTNTDGNRPLNVIFSFGTSGRDNDNNIIRANLFVDFFNENRTSFGVNISRNSNDWSVTGNSFYETTNMIPLAANNYTAIHLGTSTPHKVTNNFIGGSQAFCGGTPWRMNSSFPTFFCGIAIIGNIGASSLVQNNNIQNFNYSSTNANPWDGIYSSSGNVTIVSNTIGVSTGIDSIVLTTPNAAATATITGGVVTTITLVGGGSGFTTAPTVSFTASGSNTPATAIAIISGGIITGFTITNGGSGYTSIPRININDAGFSTTHGIRYINTGTITIDGNFIGGITTNGNSAYSHCFEAIVISGTTSSAITISNNLIGSLSSANSINANTTSSSSLFKQDVRGIYVNSAISLVTINGNTIANMTNRYTGTQVCKVDGICTSGASNIVTNNVVRNITSSANSAVRGIQQTVNLAGTSQTISGNTIYNLSNTHPTASVVVAGIDYTGSVSGTNLISGNFIYDLSASSSNLLTEISGILLGNGVTTTANNIVSLGADITRGYRIFGLNDSSSNNAIFNNNIYFNSVYISGVVTSGPTSLTAALANSNNTSVRNYRNNILMNVRTGGSVGKHFAVRIAGLQNLTINNNDYVVAGGAFLGLFANNDRTTLASWKTTTNQDTNSLNTNPLFTDAGSSNPLNYFTSAILPAATGTGIITDFTGLSRSVAPKMGALEITAYIWSGVTNTNFGTASNWQNGSVPPDGSDISFAASPLNNCQLDQNRTLRNITNAQSTYNLLLNGNQLTLTGNLVFSNSAKLDARAPSSVLVLGGTVPQNIPLNALVSNTADGLTVNNLQGISLNNDITISNTLALTNGQLNIGNNTATLNGTIAATSGTITGGNTSNIIVNGSGTFNLPNVAVNNLTFNRSGSINLVGSVSVSGTLALTSGTVTVGVNTLTLSGNSPTRVSGGIDAGNAESNIIFNNTSAIVLPPLFFVGAVSNLTVSGSGGITAGGNFTINGILNMPTANPSATTGTLSTGIYTLTMGGNATTIGIGDVSGIVTRNSITANTIYTFGNTNTSIIFPNSGTLPTSISLKIDLGVAPSWKTGAINRTYDFIQSGGSGTKAVLKAHYLDSELNGNIESKLVNWVRIYPTSTTLEQGRSNYNTTANYVELTNVNVGLYFASAFGVVSVTLAESAAGALIWNGSVSDSWTTATNWTPNATPSDDTAVFIPDAATTPNDPTLNPSVLLGTLDIQSGGILNAPANSQFTINGGLGAWINKGTYNSGTGTSTVIFTSPDTTIAGVTIFNNVTVSSGAALRPLTENYMAIAGIFTNNGVLYFGSIENIVDYIGTNQVIAAPNGGMSAYHNLTINGTGAIFPNVLNITDVLTLNQDVNFSGKTIIMSGVEPQFIDGSSSPTFDNLTIINTFGEVTLMNNTSVTGTLTLTTGLLKVETNTLTLGATAVSGSFNATKMIVVSPTGQVRRSFTGIGSYTFPIGENNGNTDYSPITVTVTAGTFASAYVGVTVVDAIHPDVNSIGNTISRYWNVAPSGITNAVANISATYTPGDIIGLEANIAAAELIGTFNQQTNPWIKFATLGNATLTATDALLNAGQTAAFTGIKGAVFSATINGFGTFCQNETITLTAPPINGDGPYTHLWSSELGTEYTALPPTAAVGTTSYTVIVKDANGITATDTVTITVLTQAIGGTVSSNQSVCSGSQADDLTLSGYTGSVASWQSADENSFSNPVTIVNSTNILSGAAIGALSSTTYYRAALQNGSCSTVYSEYGTITVNTASVGGSVSGGTAICSGAASGLLTLSGQNGSVNHWEYTVNPFSSWTTIANTTATFNPGIVTQTTHFRAVIQNESCAEANSLHTVITVNSTTTTDGGVSWSNGTPTSSKSVVFDGATGTIGTNFAACSLRLTNNATVSVNAGFDVTLEGILTVNPGSAFTLNNNANLIQTTTIANSGNIVVKQNSSPLKRLDYTLWSSPVAGQGLYAFSKFTLPNRFYVYDTATDLYSNSVGFSLTDLQYPSPLVSPNGVDGSDAANITFTNGLGYLIRVPYNHSTVPTVYNGIFTGVPNNGAILPTVTTALNGFNAVGNPYPSRINVANFIDGNTNTTGSLYFWRKTNTTAASTSYATLTKTAYVANGSAGGDTGTGFFNTGNEANWDINIGQGFIVRATSGSTISFTNSMRRSSNDNQFFRDSQTVNTASNGLYWLNLTDNTGVYSQMAVGYSSEGTLGFDRGIDGESINKEFYLTSLIGTNEYSIQGRSDFDSSDIVPLSYKAITVGNYSISIDHTAGGFTTATQNIYLKDNLTTTLHDLNSGAYTFATAAGTFNSRFEIVYQTQLANPTFTANAVVIYNQNNEFVVNSGNIIMSLIKVFDVRGRLLQEKNNLNTTQTSIGSCPANQVLIIQITSEDGVVVTKKVVR